MKNWLSRIAAAAALVGLAAFASRGMAQGPVGRPLFVPSIARQSIDPNPYIAPGLRLQQYAYNTRVLGRAYASVPPYALGYNPYPAVVNYGPTYPAYYPYGYNSYYGYPYTPYNLYYPSASPYFP